MVADAPVKPDRGASGAREPRIGNKGRLCVVHNLSPNLLVFVGYLSYVLIGWLLLSLPWAQRGQGAGSLDNLFIATSAVSTTGLVTVSVADSYSFFGQLIILSLIQLGGIGYMTLGSCLTLARKEELSSIRTSIAQKVYTLPASFRVAEFLKSVIWFTLGIELIGAAALYAAFIRVGAPQPLWCAVFHSVSAFCTAGFGLFNDSFASYADDFWLNAILAALSYLGALGFIVCLDFWRILSGGSRQTTFTTKIILWLTLWMTIIGTSLLFINEPSLRSLPPYERLLAAFFQCMTSMTTVGFNTVDIASMSKASLLLIIVFMIIGSSPSGTGGGVKATTFTAMLGVMRSAMRGERETRLWGRRIPVERVSMAFAGLGFYLAAFVIGTYLLELSESTPFEQNLFEAASALGTVGLSMGITAMLSPLGKVILIMLMFCGRCGPLTFGSAILGRAFARGPKDSDGDIAV